MIKESSSSIEDIKFAPSYLTFQIASVSSDSNIYFHEISKNGNILKKLGSIKVSNRPIHTVSYCKNQMLPNFIVVGTSTLTSGLSYEKMIIYMKQKESWKSVYQFESDAGSVNYTAMADVNWAHQNGRSFHYILSISFNRIYVFKLKIDEDKISPNPITILYSKIMSSFNYFKPTLGFWNYNVSLVAK